MIFSSKATPRWQRVVAGAAATACALALTVLAACGGGTTQYELFVPERLFAFGDETSMLGSNGRKYGVNSVNADTGLLDCAVNPIWVQQVASLYGFAFAECNPNNVPDPQARMYANVGAKVADVAAQVEGQVAAGGFRDTDMVLVLVGANDLLELYSQYPVRPEASLVSDARARGEELARVVNRLVGLGAKVIVSNVPDMGYSPFALAERAANTDLDRAALISRLAAAFNDALGVTVLLDGRYIGLMQTDLRIQSAQRSPGSFGLGNVTTGVCTIELPQCTTRTLIADANASLYLWADGTRLAPGGQSMLASLAVARATRNPF